MRYRLLILIILLCAVILPVSAETSIGQLHVPTTALSSAKELVSQSDLILIGWIDSAHKAYPTGRTISQGKIVNYTQTLQVKKVFKGSSSRLVTVLSTGVEPLPDASSQLNLTYTGPLGEGNYLVFLRKVKGSSSLYSLSGLWQGVYPLYQGKTIALQGVGFSEFNQLSWEEIEQKLKAIQP
ncbi:MULTISPECIES: hypothetical protein [Brevibacillus]|uniref:Uncharacterized protein n=1 Tax=Brevibacillus parabrevis TaxID=54914 RepID=A0A4Y3PWC1_BREPA|nr:MULTISPECIES: hypothetical protein [Brevibacillus]MBU8710895.1 hypothetical protein [Brevibacillus parabrevis]MDH6351744.1 hypothetical protein [Brevibacillus sp. 1238]MED2253564.1 hypothetical protein [Brevibacillus parabrevis]NRQ55387.1 hypothetical protein [Brevibacillus sp. HD1.4A]RNB90797.1 hypothetical protein EDM60_28055 [Brevibacillus parabrevis]